MANPSRAPHTLEVGDGIQDCTWTSRHSMHGLPPVCYQYQWPLTEVCCPLLQVWHLDIYRHFFLSLGYPAVERATRAHCHCWLPRGLQGSADHPTEEALFFFTCMFKIAPHARSCIIHPNVQQCPRVELCTIMPHSTNMYHIGKRRSQSVFDRNKRKANYL